MLVVLVSVVIAMTVADKIDKFLGLVGALLCAPLAMTIPAMVHLRMLAKTTKEKVIDLIFIVGSLAILLFCTVQQILVW